MSLKGVVTQASIKGPRQYQEDRVVHIPFVLPHERGHLLAIFDGHGGDDAAQVCANALPHVFKPGSVKYTPDLLRAIVSELVERTKDMRCGTTISLACILEQSGVVVTATLGDSPIIVVDKHGCIWTNNPHNVRGNLAEREAVIARGGVYDEQGGYIHNAPDNDYGLPSSEGLQLGRAAGDKNFRYLLSREPDIARYVLGRKSAVLVCSDGLINPMDLNRYVEDDDLNALFEEEFSIEALNLVHSSNAAERLIRWKEGFEPDDNTSVIAWRPQGWLERLMN